MPFTLAHPAAVLPLRRVPLLMTVPLIIGAVAPDIPYYFPARIAQYIPHQTHTLRGTFTLDVPMGMAVLLILWFLRAPLTAPLGARARTLCCTALQRFGCRPLHWMLAPLSILVGAWTHVLWDSFTHPYGWMVQHIAMLRVPITIGGYSGELCHVLQYLSSVLGLTALAIWFLRRPAPSATDEPPARSGGLILMAALLLAAAAPAGIEVHRDVTPHITSIYRICYLVLTRMIAWFALFYTIAGLVIARVSRLPVRGPVS